MSLVKILIGVLLFVSLNQAAQLPTDSHFVRLDKGSHEAEEIEQFQSIDRDGPRLRQATSKQATSSVASTTQTVKPTEVVTEAPDKFNVDTVGLVQPTIINAKFLNCTPASTTDGYSMCHFIVETRARAYKLNYDFNLTGSIDHIKGEEFKNPINSGFKSAGYDSFGKMTHQSEIQYASEQLKYLAANKKTVLGDGPGYCRQQLFKVSQRFLHEKDHYLLGVNGIDLCLIKYKANYSVKNYDSGRNFNDELYNIEDTYSVKNLHLNGMYQISAMLVMPSQNLTHRNALVKAAPMTALLFDEIGNMYLMPIFLEKDPEPLTKPHMNPSAWSLSALELYGRNARLTFLSPQLTEKMADSFRAIDGGKGYHRMKEHFELSSIQAISMYNKTLYFTQGLYRPQDKWMKIVGRGIEYSLFNNSDQKTSNALIHALEFYQEENRLFVHVITSQFVDKEFKNLYMHYDLSQFVEPAKEETQADLESRLVNVDEEKQKFIGQIPNDIVYWKTSKCKKVVTFWNYIYKLNDYDEPIYAGSNYHVASWMKFPLSAALFTNNKFYFFSFGNTLYIMDYVQDSNCNTLTMNEASLKEYQASELMRHFISSHSAGKANFDLRQYELKFGVAPVYTGYQEYYRNKWTPEINTSKPIDMDETLFLMTNKTVGSNSSALVILIIAAFLILLMICAMIYYVYFYRPAVAQSVAPPSETDDMDSAMQRRYALENSILNKSPTIRSNLVSEWPPQRMATAKAPPVRIAQPLEKSGGHSSGKGTKTKKTESDSLKKKRPRINTLKK